MPDHPTSSPRPAARRRRARRHRQVLASSPCSAASSGRPISARRRHQRHLHRRGRPDAARARESSRPSGSAPSRPAPARTRRSATTSPPTCWPSRTSRPTSTRLDLVLVESGGDNLTATFSPALVDAQIFVLDVAGGGDVVRKGGPGISRADLLVVNKTDLAPYVGVDAELMVRQGGEARDGRPVLGLSRTDPDSVAQLLAWVEARLADFRGGHAGSAGPRPDGGARPRSRSRHHAASPPRTEPTPVSHTRLEVCRDPPAAASGSCVAAPTGRAGEGTSGSASCTPAVDGARVAVLAEGALLVAGDDVSVGMRVGPGVRLDVVEPAGTVAFDMRGGSARWGVDCRGRRRGRAGLAAPKPFVVATGAVVDRERRGHAARIRRRGAARGARPRARPRGRWRRAATAPRDRCGPAAARRGPRSRRRSAAGRRHRRPPCGRLGDRSRAASRSLHSRRRAPAGARRARGRSCGTSARRRIPRRWSPSGQVRRRRPSRRAGSGMTGALPDWATGLGAAAAPGGRLVRRDLAQRDVGRGARIPSASRARNGDLLPPAARRGVRLAPGPVGRAVAPPPRFRAGAESRRRWRPAVRRVGAPARSRRDERRDTAAAGPAGALAGGPAARRRTGARELCRRPGLRLRRLHAPGSRLALHRRGSVGARLATTEGDTSDGRRRPGRRRVRTPVEDRGGRTRLRAGP